MALPQPQQRRRLPWGQRGEPQLTQNGVQFALADGTFSNVFHAGFLTRPTDLDFQSVPPFPQGPMPPNRESPVVFRARVVG